MKQNFNSSSIMRMQNSRSILLCYLYLLVTLTSGAELPTHRRETGLSVYREFVFGLLCITMFIGAAFVVWGANALMKYTIKKLRSLLPSNSGSSVTLQSAENQFREAPTATADKTAKENANRNDSKTFFVFNNSQADNVETKAHSAAKKFTRTPEKKIRTRDKEKIHSTQKSSSDIEEVEFDTSNYAQVEYAEMIPYRTARKSPKSKHHEENIFKRDSDHKEIEFATSNYAQVEYAAMIPFRTAGKSSKAKGNEENISRRENSSNLEENEFTTSNYAQVEYAAMIPYTTTGKSLKTRDEDELSASTYDTISPYSEMRLYRAPPAKSAKPRIYGPGKQDDVSAFSSTEGVLSNDEYAEVDRSITDEKRKMGRVKIPAWLLEDVDDENTLPDLPAAYGTVNRNSKPTSER